MAIWITLSVKYMLKSFDILTLCHTDFFNSRFSEWTLSCVGLLYFILNLFSFQNLYIYFHNLLLFCFVYYLYIYMFIYLLARKRERASESTGRDRKRREKNLKQAPGSAQSPTLGSISQPWHHDLSQIERDKIRLRY